MNSLDTVRSLYRAMREKDDPTVFVLCTEDIVWEQSKGFPGGSTWHGPAEVIEKVFRANAKRWTGFAFTEEEMFAAGADRIVVLGHYSGTSPATGKAMRAAVAHIYDLRDGRICRFACSPTRSRCGRR